MPAEKKTDGPKRGRPPLTEAQKAEKAAQKAAGATKAPKAAKAPKGPKAPIAQRYNSPVDEESRALFLQTLPKIADLKAKLNTANSNLRNAYKTAKKDGFLKVDFDIAFQLQQPEGEKARKATIARDLTIAKWMGCDLGSQLDMFVQDERVPAVDRAFEEGVACSMEGKPAKPGYDPATEQYRSFMAGFHKDQERLHKGFKKLKPETPEAAIAADEAQKATERAKVEAQKAADAANFDNDEDEDEETAPETEAAPTSGVPMTRSQFAARQKAAEAATANGTSVFAKKA